jgi:3',5'-cyclic AMP phosphodiesterase CpdA
MTAPMTRRQFIAATGALLGGLAAGRIAAQPAGFTFAAMNDLHLQVDEGGKALATMVDALNARDDLDFTVVLGDLTTAAKPEEFALAKAGLDRLRKPHFVVPGNHDADKDGVPGFEQAFGPANWRHEHAGWVLLGLNSTEGVSSDVTIPPDRLEWLKKEVGTIDPATPIALFLHHPLNPHSKAYRVKNAEEVLALFQGHALRLAAAGHFHGNQEERRDGILFTTTACCAGTRGNHDKTTKKGYRLFHCKGDQIETEFVVVAL